MKKKPNFLLKTIILVIVVLLLVIEGVPFLINLYLNANAERIVGKMITRTRDFGGHEVNFGNIRLDYNYRGTLLHLSDVKISPGEEITGKNKIRLNLSFDEASLTGFSWGAFLINNSIRLDSAFIQNVKIESITPPLDSLDSEKQNRSGREGKDYDQVSVSRIRVNQASFENRDSYTDSTRLSVKDLFVFGETFILTREDLNDPNALFKINSIEGYMDQAVLHLNGYRNAVFANDLSFNTTDEKINIDQVRFENKLSKYGYVNQFEKETDWIELEQGSVLLEGMDFQAYFREGSVKAQKLRVDDMKLVLFRDKRKPEDLEKRPKMIHEILRELPLTLDLQEVEVRNGYVSYEERPENEAPRAGTIFFDEINAQISGVTNSSEHLENNDEMVLAANSRLMGKGLIDLKVTYFLNDTTGKFLMEGNIGSMDLLNLNQMIEPSTKVTLRNGTLNSLFFNIVANDIEGTGEVIVKYEDLEIEILDKDFGYDQNIFQKIGSFLANKLIIKSQNPEDGELKKGGVYYPRDQHKFIFKYWWELILSGLKSTLTGDTEEDLRRKAK
ncbi:MAG: hypothetical protein WD426_19825 [Anditalea sp.]